MRVLDVRLFGQAVVSADGTPLKFLRRPVTVAMLAYLLLHRDRPVSRDFLAFLLFPDSEESAALAELRRYLYLAVKALPASDVPWVLTDGETLQWNPAAPVRLDVAEFERLAADPNTATRALDEYRGDLLEDAYDDWIVVERERLRAQYLAMLTRSVGDRRALRDYAGAIVDAGRLLAADPWREDIVRDLVAIRYESGDAAGAIAEYDAFAKRLRAELGVAPMPETLAVREAIVRNAAVPGSLDARYATSDAAPVRALPFVGRTRELEAILAGWRRAARGNGGLLVIAGEAGVGKTRLASEAARRAANEGGRVLSGTTAAPETAPYQAFVEAFASALPLINAQPPEPHHRAVLGQLVAGAAGNEAATAANAAPERRAARMYAAIGATIRRLASPRPLLIVLEDLQWAGTATIDALAAVVRDVARSPVLVIVTIREEETPRDHPFRAMLRSLALGERTPELSLDRLGRDDVAALVERIDGLPAGDETVRELYARSEGNALFLSEAIAEALEAGARPQSGGGERPLAASIAAIVAARTARLSDDARTVAEIAAIAGPGCSVELVREVANLPAVATARGFDELLDRRIVREAGARGRYDFVFTHHLIADAVYRSIDPATRTRRHARIAKVLEATSAPGDAALARQIAVAYERGESPHDAARWYVAAARGAAAVHAHADAATLAGKALALEAHDVSIRAAALGVRESAHARLGERERQRDDLDALEALASEDGSHRFDLLLRRIALARSLGDAENESVLVSQLGALAATLGDAERAQALRQEAAQAGLRSRQRDGLAPAMAALAAYERLGDVEGQLESLFLLVDFTTNLGDLASAAAYLARLRARATSLADRAIEARALAVTATAALLRQEYAASLEMTKSGLALSRAIGDREGEAGARARLAVTAAWLGQLALALDEFPRAIEAYEELDHKRGIAVTSTNYTMLLMRVGLLDEARAAIERSNALFETVGERRTLVANASNASVVNLLQGDAAAAEVSATAALAIAREIGFPVFEAAALANLANAERELGRYDDAIAHHQAALALRATVQQPHDYLDDLADATITYAAAGRNDDARAAADVLRAVADVSVEGAFWPHYVYWALGRGYAAAGDRDRAAAYAAKARASLSSLAATAAETRAGDALLRLPLNAEIAASDGLGTPAARQAPTLRS